MDISRYLSHSAKIETDDIDWSVARAAGLTDGERFILTYFSDIEGQTIIYLRDLLHTRVIEDSDAIAFFSMWNYEEFFHGDALARLLAECSSSLERGRIAHIRKGSRITETLEAFGGRVLSKIFPSEFYALFLAWGAMNELTTLNGYRRLGQTTSNPVLKTLCNRILKQEARHFSWYWVSAREKLAVSVRAQRLVRWILSRFWTPVGVGVKTGGEAYLLLTLLFPGELCRKTAREIDDKIAALPGLDRLTLLQDFTDKHCGLGESRFRMPSSPNRTPELSGQPLSLSNTP